MSDARRQLAWRPRRMLYNDDGLGDVAYTTPDELIAARVGQVTGTQVDSICYCTGGGGLFWGHQSRAGEVLGEYVTDDDAQYVRDTRDGLKALKQLGTDPLAAVVDHGHRHGMEVFWSYRMNNPEDSFAPWSLSRWKREHPEYLMGDSSAWDHTRQTEPRTWWTLCDFARPEVRAHVLSMFADVCSRYDVDGVELDFIRHPLYFRPNLDGLAAEPEQVAMMTDLVRRIREMAEAAGARRGRPLLVIARAPLSVESALAIGLDVPTYLGEDLVDILIAGQDYIQMAVASALRDMVDLGLRHQVPVYALLTPPQPYDIYRYDDRAWRGAAMNRFYWGAAGIYTFNLFPGTPDPKFSELGSVETLKGLDKIYAIDNLQPDLALGTFRLALVGPDLLPLELVPGRHAAALLPVGEDIVANAPPGKTVSALLRLEALPMAAGDSLAAKLNGHSLGNLSPAEGLAEAGQRARFEVKVDPCQVTPGHNSIELQLTTGRDASVAVDFVDLVVSYA